MIKAGHRFAILAAVALSGCGQGPGYEACKLKVGPEPQAVLAHDFGILGAFAAATDPERDAWNRAMWRCRWGDNPPVTEATAK